MSDTIGHNDAELSRSMMIEAPWTDAQVQALAIHQMDPRRHPYTCDSSWHDATVDLIATNDGWVCPLCDYKQTWAWAPNQPGDP